MAIFPGLPGVEVTILINGMAVWEYDDDDEVDFKPDELSQYQALKTISKYIESMTDEEFTIQLSVTHPYKFDCEALGFEVFVDGRKVRSPLLKKEDFLITSDWKSSIEGVKTGDAVSGWQVRRFKFAAIETTMDDDKMRDVKEEADCINKVGEIAVWVYRKSNVHRNGTMDSRDALGMRYDNAVHEKALHGQAKSRGTMLGEVQASKASNKFSSKKMDGDGRPIAIYKFKYRSRDALESLLVVARTPDFERPSAPTPNRALRRYAVVSPDAQPMDLDNATPEEKQLMAAYLAGIRGSGSPQIKMEQGIKREEESQNAGGFRKKVKQEGAVVVDLTMED